MPRSRRRAAALIAVIALTAVAAACGGDDGGPAPTTAPSTTAATAPAGPPAVIAVPADRPTIQAAVDAARTGDMVLVSPGTYHESVVVTTPGVTVRGLDRNAVVLDGQDALGNGVMLVAPGGVVENLTVTRYNFNGVLITGSQGQQTGAQAGEPAAGATSTTAPDGAAPVAGYRVSYVTAYNNGLYGIYAFGARGGQIDHSYASGHPDSGIYVGQCKPCDVLVTDNVAELNRVGYEGTNAGGNTYIVNSVWRSNRIGITIDSEDTELLAPQDGAVVAGNLVSGNAAAQTPDASSTGLTGLVGLGIGIGGGTNNLVTRNRIVDNRVVGVAVTDLAGYSPSGNRVVDNVVSGHDADLALYSTDAPVAALGNCFAGNAPATTWPDGLESLLPCDGAGAPPADAAGPTFGAPAPGLDYRTMPAPPAQASMPDAATAPFAPAEAVVPSFDASTAVVPEG